MPDELPSLGSHLCQAITDHLADRRGESFEEQDKKENDGDDGGEGK